MRRSLLVLSAAASLAVLAMAGPASASHPCHKGEPCTGHRCITLEPPFLHYC